MLTFRWPIELLTLTGKTDQSFEYALTALEAEIQAREHTEGTGLRFDRVAPRPDALLIDGAPVPWDDLPSAVRERAEAVLRANWLQHVRAIAGRRAA